MYSARSCLYAGLISLAVALIVLGICIGFGLDRIFVLPFAAIPTYFYGRFDQITQFDRAARKLEDN